jgi:site-specific DNA-methyltransferase (adenine-specific)
MEQTIIQGDCTTTLAGMQETFDVIVCSPPYNIKKEYNTYTDDLPYAEYLLWMDEFFQSVNRVLKDDGSFFLNIGGTCKEPTRALDVCNVALKHFKLQNDILWVKSVTVEDVSYGHFKPINSTRFLNRMHESVFHFTKTGDIQIDRLGIGVTYKDKFNAERWSGKQDLRCRGNVWFIPYETVRWIKKPHSAGFPVKLPEYCILMHGLKPEMKVLDPFLGAGSTLIACKKLGIAGTGIELDPYYCGIAKESLETL